VELLFGEFSGTTEAELEESVQSQGYGFGFVSSPADEGSNPPFVAPIIHSLKSALQNRYGSQDFAVKYLGFYSILSLGEIIVTSPSRLIRFAELNLKMLPDTVSLTYADLIDESSGIGALDNVDTSQPVYLLDYIPSSQDIQGSSILANALDGDLEYLSEWINLQKTIFSTLQAIANDSFSDPFDSLQKRLGSSILPAGLNEKVEFQVQIYGRTMIFSETVTFPVDVKQLASGEVHMTYLTPISNLNIMISLSLVKESSLSVVEAGCTIPLQLIPSNETVVFDSETNSVSWGGGNFLWKNTPCTIADGRTVTIENLSFQPTSIDVYPSSSLYPSSKFIQSIGSQSTIQYQPEPTGVPLISFPVFVVILYTGVAVALLAVIAAASLAARHFYKKRSGNTVKYSPLQN